MTTPETPTRPAAGPGRSHHRRRRAGSASRRPAGSPPRGPGRGRRCRPGGGRGGGRRGRRAVRRATDVTDEAAVDDAVRGGARAYGSVDIAFNNAGISPPDDDSILDTGLEAWRRVQEVNLTSVYLCCKAAIPYMQRAGQGIDHQHGVVRRRHGRGDLADLLHRVQGRGARDEPRARRAVRPRGHPGQRAVPRAGQHAAAAGAVREGPGAGRAAAGAHAGRAGSREPEEIAAAVAFLATDDASFITASTFLVDGGISAAYTTPL